MFRVVFVVLCAGLLAGCLASLEEVTAAHDQQCRSYGAQPGSDAYIQCRMMLSNQIAQANAQRRAALVGMGTAMMATPAPASPVVCQTTPTGFGSSQTTCR